MSAFEGMLRKALYPRLARRRRKPLRVKPVVREYHRKSTSKNDVVVTAYLYIAPLDLSLNISSISLFMAYRPFEPKAFDCP
jgi:hypothetical protein